MLNEITQFAAELDFKDLPSNAVVAAKERLADSIACALAAYRCDTATVGREVAAQAIRPELAGRILGSADLAAADAAAFINSCMIRNLDFNDTYPGGHPSDSLGAMYAVAPVVKASGERLVTATVVAYEVFIRLQMKAQLRERGWDQGFGISVGAAAGLANLLGLSFEQTMHATSITAVANMPMRASRAGQLSMWKGAATAYAVRNAVFGVQIAQAGMTGPEAPFTGRHGLTELVSGPIELPPFGKTAEHFYIPRAKIKYWPVVYNMQALVWAAIELRSKVAIDDIESIDVETYWSAWHESGSEPAKWDPRTRETADHSLPYILAWTLRHGTIDERAFVPEAYLDPSVRPLMNRVTVRIDDAFEKDFPRVVRMRMTIKDRQGQAHQAYIENPLGHEDNPVSMKDLEGKFVRLCEEHLGRERAQQAWTQWLQIESARDVTPAFDALMAR